MSPSQAHWLTSQLYQGHHLGSPSPTTQGYHPAMVGNQDPQPPLRPMELTMAQYQASCQPLPQPSLGAPPASTAQSPWGQTAYGQFGQEDAQNGPSSTAQMHRRPRSQSSRSAPWTLVVSQPPRFCPLPPPTKAQVTAHLARMQVGRAVAPVPPTVRVGYGPPTSARFPNPGLYGSYPRG